jgi:hypothetical protein
VRESREEKEFNLKVKNLITTKEMHWLLWHLNSSIHSFTSSNTFHQIHKQDLWRWEELIIRLGMQIPSWSLNERNNRKLKLTPIPLSLSLSLYLFSCRLTSWSDVRETLPLFSSWISIRNLLLVLLLIHPQTPHWFIHQIPSFHENRVTKHASVKSISFRQSNPRNADSETLTS